MQDQQDQIKMTTREELQKVFPIGKEYQIAPGARKALRYGIGPFQVIDHLVADEGGRVVLRHPSKGQFAVPAHQIR